MASWIGTGGSDPGDVETNGNLGITSGGSDPSERIHVKSSNAYSKLRLDTYDNGTRVSALQFVKSDTDTVDSVVETDNGDRLGLVEFYGVNASPAFVLGAQIACTQDYSAGATYVPARLGFFVSDGSSAAAEALRITRFGLVGAGTTSPASTLETGGSFGVKVVSKTSSYTAGHEVVILVSTSGADITITLPAASATAGRIICVKKLTSGDAVVLSPASGNIDGSATKSITTQYGCVQVVSDGTNWHIIAEK